MRILRPTGTYLSRKIKLNLGLAAFNFTVFVMIFMTQIRFLPTYIDVSPYEGARALFMLIPAFMALQYYRQYRNYKLGFEGENQVTKVLNYSFDDNYYLINDIKIPDVKGNIDHIVLAPNGVFVIETKNYRGDITCHGDHWSGKNWVKRTSPSKQARINAFTVKNLIESLEDFYVAHIWVQPIVVFTNYDVRLHIFDPTAKILMIHELPRYLSEENNGCFSAKNQAQIGKEIIKHVY